MNDDTPRPLNAGAIPGPLKEAFERLSNDNKTISETVKKELRKCELILCLIDHLESTPEGLEIMKEINELAI